MAGSKMNLKGQKFGRLLVIQDAGSDKHRAGLWKCLCECGQEIITKANSLRQGVAKSCGCLREENCLLANTTHGLSKHPLYGVWRHMKSRCQNPKNSRYCRYGGRGIKVCARWLESFENFYNDVIEGYEKGLQIDRKDNDGNYEPSNVRWVTHQQNQMNKGAKSNGTSQYKGVCWDGKKWLAQIHFNGEVINLGRFLDEKEAAIVYNEAALRLFKEYANINVFLDQ